MRAAAILILLAVFLGAPACASAVSPTARAGAETVDVLDFIVGAADQWPRHGDQHQYQTVDWDARQVCWVKYANSSMFECWGWDDQWVYHIPMSQPWFETRDAGGELGVRDVLILASASYAPGAAPGPAEKFYFARGAGWYRWESVRGSRSFDRKGGPTVAMAPGCGK